MSIDPQNPYGYTESDCPAGTACKEVHCIVHGPGGVLERQRHALAEAPTSPQSPKAKSAPPPPAASSPAPEASSQDVPPAPPTTPGPVHEG